MTDALYRWADAIRDLPKVAEASGADVAEALLDHVTEHASRGESPDGTPWELTQEGADPLRNALAHVTTAHTERGALIRVSGHYALHNSGRVTGGKVRRVIPEKLDAALGRRIGAKVTARLLRHTRGD